MKLFLILIVFACFVFAGIYVYFRYYYRFVLYKDLIFVCKNLKNNISFNKNQINSILSLALKNVSKKSKNLIITGKDSLMLYSKDDIKNVNDFTSSLGKGDVDYEIHNITYFENNFMDLREVAKEKLDKNGIVYLKLFIFVGLAFFIMLL